MKQFATEAFLFKADNGERIAFKTKISVDAQGYFCILIPEDHVDRCMGIGGVTQKRSNAYICGETLKAAKENLKKIFDAILACEVTETPVVRVQGLASCHYCIDDTTGEIYPSGKEMKADVDRYTWQKDPIGTGRSADSSPDVRDFSVGLKAALRIKKVTSRQGTEKVEYLIPAHAREEHELGPWALKLNSFVRITFSGYRSEARDVREFAYTEAVCKFCYESMMALCVMDRNLRAFMADDDLEQRMTAIALNGGNMLTEGDR